MIEADATREWEPDVNQVTWAKGSWIEGRRLRKKLCLKFWVYQISGQGGEINLGKQFMSSSKDSLVTEILFEYMYASEWLIKYNTTKD